MVNRQFSRRSVIAAILLVVALGTLACRPGDGSDGGVSGVQIAPPAPSMEVPTATPRVPEPRSAWSWPDQPADHVPVEDAPLSPIVPIVEETAATLAPAPPERGSAAGWSVQIAAIGVEAPLITLGVSAAGVMEVPADATTVAWYEFTALPGHAGNAVLAAHVDWRGELGVFNRLDELTPGSTVTLTSPDGGTVEYEVRSVELVDPATADVAALIGGRSGEPTLTMITCGGDFNYQTRDYERRVIVRATRAAQT